MLGHPMALRGVARQPRRAAIFVGAVSQVKQEEMGKAIPRLLEKRKRLEGDDDAGSEPGSA